MRSSLSFMSADWMRRVSYVCALALVILVPLVTVPPTLGSAEAYKGFIILAVAIKGITASFFADRKEGRFIRPSSWGWGMLLLTLGAVIVSAWRGRAGIDAWVNTTGQEYQSVLLVLGYAATAWLFALTITTTERVRMVLRTAAITALIALIAAFAVVLPHVPTGWNTVGTITSLVGYVGIVLVGLGAHWMVASKELMKHVPRWSVGVAIGLAAMTGVWMLVVHAHAVWTWLIVTVAMLAAWMWKQQKQLPSGKRLVALLGVFGLALVMSLSKMQLPLPIPTPAIVGLSAKASITVARAALITSNPLDALFGAGPAGFVQVYQLAKPASIASSNLYAVPFDRASSDLLTSLVTTGLVAVLAFSAWLVWGMYELNKRLQNASAADRAVGYAVLAMTGAAAVWHVVATANVTLHWLIFACVGMVYGFTQTRKEKTIESASRKGFLTLFAMVVWTVVTVGIVLISASVAVASSLRSHALARPHGTSLTEIGRELSWALRLNPVDATTWSAVSQVTLAQAIALATSKDVQVSADQVQAYMQAAVETGMRATELAPTHVAAWTSLASVYVTLAPYVDNADQAALEAYVRAQQLDPYNPTIAVQQGILYLTQADEKTRSKDERKVLFEQADQAFQRATGIKPNDARAYYYRAVIAERLGNLEEASTRLAALVQANPSQVSLQFEWALLELRLRRYTNAVQILDGLRKQLPNDANVVWYSALAYEGVGNLDVAQTLLQQLADRYPEHPQVQQRLKAVQQGLPLSADIPEPIAE